MGHIVQETFAAAVYHIEGLLHVQMPMNRNAAPRLDLLCPQSHGISTRISTYKNKNVPAIPEVDKVLTSTCIQYPAAGGESSSL